MTGMTNLFVWPALVFHLPHEVHPGKQQMGLPTFGGCVADVIDDGVVAAGRTAGRLALGETPPPRRLKEGEQSPVASVPSSLLVVVVDDTPVVVVVVVVVVAPSRTD